MVMEKMAVNLLFGEDVLPKTLDWKEEDMTAAKKIAQKRLTLLQ